MSKPNIKQLKQAVNDVSKGDSTEKRVEALTRAFDLFTKETDRLEKAYEQLKENSVAVNKQLADANRKLQIKLIEFDAITHYLNSFLSNISQGIFFIDLNGGVTTYNEAAQLILQISQEKVLFNSFWTNFKDDAFGFSMREALASRKPTGSTYASYELPDGTQKELEIETSLVLNAGPEKGTPVDAMQGMILLIRDITEIRRLQLIANRHDRLKELGEMAAMVAHEIRNPLGGIKGFASLLQRDLKDQPKLEQMARYIIEGTDNLNRLVTTVLNYARPIQPHLDAVNLNNLVKELIQHIKADPNYNSKAEFILNEHHQDIWISADSQLLKSTFLNLAINSIQAMPEGGVVTLSIDRTETMAIIKVADTGVGIPPENLDKLYSPFFTTRADGNGFGLSEVLKMVQAHGGTIEVQSDVNKGTEFTIHIPLKLR